MSEGTEETKKGGFFGKLMKIAFIAAIVAAVVALGAVAPVHARLVFGPPGRAHVVAAGPAAA